MNSQLRRRIGKHTTCRARGFSLIECMVALIVLSVGLLGIARMQSLALSSTTVATQRSMAAIEAESLAAAMHANRAYWANTDPSGATIQVTAAALTVTTGAPLLAAAVSPVVACTSTATACTSQQMAAYDLTLWEADLKGLLPGYTALVNCGTVTPVTCTINITWAESAMGVNTQQAAQQAATPNATIQNSTYTLYVQP